MMLPPLYVFVQSFAVWYGIHQLSSAETLTMQTPSWALERISFRRQPIDPQITNSRERMSSRRFTYIWDSQAQGRNTDVYVFGTGIACHAPFFTRGHVVCDPGADFHRGIFTRSAPALHIIRSTLDESGTALSSRVAAVVGATEVSVARQTTVRAVKISSPRLRRFHTTNLIDALDYVHHRHTVLRAHAHIPIIILTFSADRMQAIDTAFARVLQARISIIIGHGEQERNSCEDTPNYMAGAIVVGGSTVMDGWMAEQGSEESSNCVAIIAPAERVLSMFYDFRAREQWYVRDSNTVFSAALVAGTLATWLSYPVISRRPDLTPERLKALLQIQANDNQISNVPPTVPNLLLFARVPEYPSGMAAAAA
ncbi:hypothetical protein PYCC9005_001135 [Savitreella phatthalungensis]